jgi:hypothetical protein
MREIASMGSHLPAQTIGDMARIIGLLTQILADGRAAGAFVDATPVLIHFMIVGALGYYAQTEAILRRHAADPAFNHPEIAPFEVAAGEIENLVVNAVRRNPFDD